jgi:predicted cupin superfamily sugar epimerase
MTPVHRNAPRVLIEALQLSPHVEGGHYREIYRSRSEVRRASDGATRAAMTAIYFLLMAGERSCWHRVSSDESWLFLEGEPLQLWMADADFGVVHEHVIGPGVGDIATVPAGHWQAARPAGGYTLVLCTVAPGFEFEDFALLRDSQSDRRALVRLRPDLDALT